MNASAWIALASLSGFILLQTTVIAFTMGRLFQRVSTVEKGHDTLSTMGNDMAEVKTNIVHMTRAIDALTAKLERVTEAEHAPVSRRRKVIE